MKIACIYWKTSSVGGIATHLNSLRKAAMRVGDTFDILHSTNWKTKEPKIFPWREWIRGGDTKIWVDGEIPQTLETKQWLEKNYDAICFGFICPHQTKAYSTPDFRILYDADLPKAALITDGYWEEYKHWAEPLIPLLNGVLCVQPSYATALRSLNLKNLIVSLAPFEPTMGPVLPKSKEPLLIWPNQWKNIKGITEFLSILPKLDKKVKVDLYSNGIRYYQLRTGQVYLDAVGKDRVDGFHGNGKATFYGNLDHAEIMKAYQRAWFTVNLQGMKTKKDTYRRGSYNYTEVEALFYGACPILHESTRQTALPKDIYLWVKDEKSIPIEVNASIKSGFALSQERRTKAREYVMKYHRAADRYKELKEFLT